MKKKDSGEKMKHVLCKRLIGLLLCPLLLLAAGCLCLCLPLLLSQSGMLHIKWVSIYPLFRFAALLGEEEAGAVLWAWPLAAVVAGAACCQYLLESYREEV